MRSLFDVCVPREDVRTGHIRESDFAADLAQVLRQDADTPDEYKEAGAFFANTDLSPIDRSTPMANVCFG